MFLPLGLLTFVTAVCLLALIAFWSGLYSYELVNKQGRVSKAGFDESFSGFEQYLNGLVSTAHFSWSSSESGHMTELFHGAPETADAWYRHMAGLALGLLQLLDGDERLYFGYYILPSTVEEMSVSFYYGDLMISNLTGDGLYHLYAVSSWSDLANGRNYTLTEKDTWPIDIVLDELEAQYLGIGLFEPHFDVWFWEDVGYISYELIRKLDTPTGYNAHNSDQPIAYCPWIGLPLDVFSQFVEKSCQDRDCVRSWILEIHSGTSRIVAASGVTDSRQLMSQTPQGYGEGITPDEFPDENVRAISRFVMSEFDQNSLFGPSERTADRLFRGHPVHVGYLNHSAAKAQFVVIHASSFAGVVRGSAIPIGGSVVLSLVVCLILTIGWLCVFVSLFRSIQAVVRAFRMSVHWMTLSDIQVVPSHFREIRLIQQQFGIIQERLLQWKKFLPRTLLKNQGLAGNVLDSGSSASFSFSDTSSQMSADAATIRTESDVFVDGFTRILGFFAVIRMKEEFDSESSVPLFKVFLEMVEDLAIRFFGTILDFSSESRLIYVGFGIPGLTPKIDGAHQAVGKFCLDVVAGCSRSGVAFSIGIAHGVAQVGTLGTNSHKKRFLTGRAIELAKLHARICPPDHFLSADVSYHREDMTISRHTLCACAYDIVFDSGKMIILHDVRPICCDILDDDEWMYCLARKQRVRAVHCVNRAFKKLWMNKLSDCLSECADIPDEASDEKTRLGEVCEAVRDNFDSIEALLVEKMEMRNRSWVNEGKPLHELLMNEDVHRVYLFSS